MNCHTDIDPARVERRERPEGIGVQIDRAARLAVTVDRLDRYMATLVKHIQQSPTPASVVWADRGVQVEPRTIRIPSGTPALASETVIRR